LDSCFGGLLRHAATTARRRYTTTLAKTANGRITLPQATTHARQPYGHVTAAMARVQRPVQVDVRTRQGHCRRWTTHVRRRARRPAAESRLVRAVATEKYSFSLHRFGHHDIPTEAFPLPGRGPPGSRCLRGARLRLTMEKRCRCSRLLLARLTRVFTESGRGKKLAFCLACSHISLSLNRAASRVCLMSSNNVQVRSAVVNHAFFSQRMRYAVIPRISDGVRTTWQRPYGSHLLELLVA
jgi:hypothetical protein